MQHPIEKITDVRVVGLNAVELTFSDGVKKVVNLEAVLHGEMYGPLQNPALFKLVAVDQEVHTIVWPNGADFDPAILRNWEDYKEEIERRARDWELVEQ